MHLFDIFCSSKNPVMVSTKKKNYNNFCTDNRTFMLFFKPLDTKFITKDQNANFSKYLTLFPNAWIQCTRAKDLLFIELKSQFQNNTI